jgi:hypothetical protein
MSRVTLNYDVGSNFDFNDKGDALYHLKAQGYAGLVNLTDEDTGKQVHTRKQLEDLLSRVAEHGLETRKDLDKILEG